jgi:hypothetical protein
MHIFAPSGADIDLIRETTNKNWVLGNERFKRQIEELAGRRASPARRGPQPVSSSANRAKCNAAFKRHGVSSLTPKILNNKYRPRTQYSSLAPLIRLTRDTHTVS